MRQTLDLSDLERVLDLLESVDLPEDDDLFPVISLSKSLLSKASFNIGLQHEDIVEEYKDQVDGLEWDLETIEDEVGCDREEEHDTLHDLMDRLRDLHPAVVSEGRLVCAGCQKQWPCEEAETLNLSAI